MEICFVLVRPAVPENVGAAARALKTMGFARLRIVGSDAHLQRRAYILAHGAGDVLDNAASYPDLAAALADVDFSIATSAKHRHDRRYNLPPAAVRAALAAKGDSVGRAAMVFGCEEAGLSNAELVLCDALTSIPLAASYPSLNLGQAVMLYAYELSALALATPVAADAGEWRGVTLRLRAALSRLDVASESPLAQWADERAAALGRDDVRFLHMLLGRLEEKLPG
jgi:tRNA/rRNA methyltransferase